MEEARVVPVLGDAYLKQGNPNQNFGGDPTLRLQASGRNRGLLFFDTQAIVNTVGSGALIAAHLELTIDSAPSGWGTSGRLVALHRLLKASDEQHATWNCSVDAWPLNGNTDCSGATAWTMWSTSNPSLHPWQATASDDVLITTGMTGGVSFDVTADVAAILDGTWAGHGFMLKKVDETASGLVDFSSRERTTMPAPRLVLTVIPPTDAGPGPVDASIVTTSVPLTRDAYIRKGNPNQNQGAASILNIQASGRNRALVGLDPSTIASQGPNGEAFVGAIVELTIAQNYENWGPDRSVGIHAVNQSWTEPGATWNCRHDSNITNVSADCADQAWNMFGSAPPTPQPFVLAPSDTVLVQSGQTGVLHWNVSYDVACYLAGHTTLPGWLIKKENEGESGHVELHTREAGTPGQLLLSYTTGPGLTVTAADCTGVGSDAGTPDAGSCSPTGADADCDGQDDDCDGTADDDYEVQTISCGVGACTAPGERSCEAGSEVDHCTPGTPGANDATCNSVDENCSGAADEGYASAPTTCGVGACASTGASSCVNGTVLPNCTPGTPAATDASCDGIDQDCNGTADEDYASVPTTCGVGACASTGVTSCVNGTVQNSCAQGTPAANDAVCDGVDSDCSGAADEDYVSLPTSCGVGACASTGATSCVNGAVQNSCVTGTPKANDAVCDGVDSDCSGAADEDYVSLPTSCGVGACTSTGATSCVNGTVQNSCAEGTPAANDAVCDGVDSDCSGTADEDYAPQDTACGVGACASTGVTSCVDGAVEDSCAPGAPAPADVSCDGVDDDCNGDADEDYVSLSTSCGIGACAATGATSCVDGEVEDSCAPGTPAVTDAVCDGIDADCSGAADEDYAPHSTSCGVGACASTAATSCVDGAVRNSCEPGAPAASDATCNGIDEDCSGAADEDYPPHATACGVGACAAAGMTSCVSGAVLDSCAPGTPAAADTTCDGIDDDCNGSPDEDYVSLTTGCGIGACAANGVTACVSAHVADSCQPLSPGPIDNTCDGIDEDCNGTADEDYVELPQTCGVGACARSVAGLCIGGTVPSSCQPGTPAASDASCDGIDDDCSGQADEDFVSHNTSCGLGPCARTGHTTCSAGQPGNTCIAGVPAAAFDTSCDGLDNDCSGQADEDFARHCNGTNAVTCQAGQSAITQCSDGNPCNGEETCLQGVCLPPVFSAMDDSNPCTSDACDLVNGITHTPLPTGTPCDDTGAACDRNALCLHLPAIASDPTTEIRVRSGSATTPQDLRTWQAARLNLPVHSTHCPTCNVSPIWSVSANGNSAEQTAEGDGGVLISDWSMAAEHIEGDFVVNKATEDDFIGLVWGYQDAGHFYLLNWKKNQTASFSLYPMSVRAVSSNALRHEDLVVKNSYQQSVELAHANVTWAANTTYHFVLDYLPGQFTLSITNKQTGAVIATFSIDDWTYIGGKFGLYQWGQDVQFSNIVRTTTPVVEYVYDVEGVIGDALETLTYSLPVAPSRMVIDQVTGLVRFWVTAEDVGSYDVSVLVDAGEDRSVEQSYVLTVIDAGRCYGVEEGSSCDDGDLCNGLEVCDEIEQCIAADPPVIDDGLPCTADSCNPASGVSRVPLPVGTACDGTGGQCDAHARCVHAPTITSTPVTEIYAAPVKPTALETLNTWQRKSLLSSATPPWTFSNANRTAVHDQNTAAHVLLSTFTLGTEHIEGTIRGAGAQQDDDFIGFVFGYQDQNHFYLFDWKRTNQTPFISPHNATAGMLVRLVDATAVGNADLIPSVDHLPSMRVLYKNSIPYASNIEYRFVLDYRPGEFTITILNGATQVAATTIRDTRYTGGKFGFYAYNQDGFTVGSVDRTSYPASPYLYDVEASSPDPDAQLIYSLVSPPPGMSIDPMTGVIRWDPSARDIGARSITVRVTSDGVHSVEQTYSLNVLQGGACTNQAAGTPCPDDTVCNGSEVCNGQGACVTGAPPTVNDGDPCTADTCDPDVGVVHTPLAEGTSCSDGNSCNGAETCGISSTTPTFVRVEPRRTFLRENDVIHVFDARPYSLTALGLAPGDTVQLSRVGTFTGWASPQQDLVAVFSSSKNLKAPTIVNRIPGALMAADALQFKTPTVSAGSTDIAHDFLVPATGVVVTVPPSATDLFLSPYNTNKASNQDLDGDWGVAVARVTAFGCRQGTVVATDDGNACTVDSCNPATGVVGHASNPSGAYTCAGLGIECGSAANGCGGQINCGSCPPGLVCGDQAPGLCGPPALPQAAVIEIPKQLNVARPEFGAAVVEPTGVAAAINAIDAITSHMHTTAYTPASSLAPKLLTVKLFSGPQVIERVFLARNPGDFEIWVSDHEPFDPATFVRALTATGTGLPAQDWYEFAFPKVKARYVRLVLTNTGATSPWTRQLDGFQVLTSHREGGIVSLLDGGADVLAASSVKSGLVSPGFAIDHDWNSIWSTATTANEWLVVDLAPAGHRITHFEIDNGADGKPAISHTPKDIELFLSATGSADADFVSTWSGTLPAFGDWYMLQLATGAAPRFAKLLAKNNRGGPFMQLASFRLYTDEIGGATVPFGERSMIPADQIASYLWTFGDGTTSTEAHPTHTFPAPGTYDITLTLTDTQGRVGVARKQYKVLRAATPDFQVSTAPFVESRSFDDVVEDRSTYEPGHKGVLWKWISPYVEFKVCAPQGCGSDFGTSQRQEKAPKIRFRQHGPLDMTLVVRDSQLLNSTVTKPVDVDNAPPTVDAGPDAADLWGASFVLGRESSAVADEGDYDRAELRCEWDFGDGSTEVIDPCTQYITRVNHIYADPGSYTARLTVHDDADSTVDSVAVTVRKHPTHVVPIAMVPTEVDGEIELWARLYDDLGDDISMVGKEIVFSHAGGEVGAITGTDSIARAVVSFEQLTYGTVGYAFPGDERYAASAEYLDYIVREDDTVPVEMHPVPGAHEGQRFVFAYPQNSWNQQSQAPVRVELTARVATQVRIRAPGVDFDETVSVAPHKVTDVTLPPGLRINDHAERSNNDNIGSGGAIEDKGVEITSPRPVSVQGVSVMGGSSSSYLALPVATLGTDYRVLGYPNEKWYFYAGSSGTAAAIVATEDDTHITIIPTANLWPGPDLPQGALRGVPLTITLDALQTFQIVSRSAGLRSIEDLSGTRITSDKPIGVYGGHTCTTVAGIACDMITEMLPPLSDWGSHFVTVPMMREKILPDALRVVAGEDDTELRIDGVLVATLDAGEVHQNTLGPRQMHEITASAPVLAAQYARSPEQMIGAPAGEGDPAMMLLPPVTQFTNSLVLSTAPSTTLAVYEFETRERIFATYVNVAARAQDVGSLLFDGVPIADSHRWMAPVQGDYAGVRIPTTPGVHTVVSTRPGAQFMAWSYGWARYSGYGNPAGMRRRESACEPTSGMPGDGLDNDCDGVADEERLDGIDNDGDGVPDEDLSADHEENQPPTLSNQIVDVGPKRPNRLPLLGTDPDGDPLTYRIVTGPSVGTATINGAWISYAPPPSNVFPGATQVARVVANDGLVDSAEAVISFDNEGGLPGCVTPIPGASAGCNSKPQLIGINYGNTLLMVPSGGTRMYRGQLHAYDFDYDEVTYRLDAGPAGFTLDPQSGAMSWLVTEAEIGDHTVSVRVTDERGGQGTDSNKTFAIKVRQLNGGSVPIITSTPPTQVAAGSTFVYQALAGDPDGGDVTYLLSDAPAGMKVTSSGLVTWTTSLEDDGKQFTAVLLVTDTQDLSASQFLTITVGQPTLEFTTIPPMTASVGETYVYYPEVVDHSASGREPMFAISPHPEGMVVEPFLGEITWIPTVDQIGEHEFVVIAKTTGGLYSEQHFTIEVSEFPIAPSIISEPVTSAVLQGVYLYDVDAVDAGIREHLRYELTSGPPGMVLDPVTGLIQWIPTALGSETVTVVVTDGSGFSDEQSFAVDVLADTTLPTVTLTATPDRVAAGGTITLEASAVDDVLVQSLSMEVDGIPVSLDANGQFSFSSAVVGLHWVTATATDLAGNVGTTTIAIGVEHAGDVQKPTLTLTSPAEDEELTYIHDIIGSVADDQGVFSYELSVRRIGESAWQVIGGGNGPRQNTVLGKLDTTLLDNGYYDLRLRVEDMNRNATEHVRPFRVDGQAKVGPVQLSFVDMALPMAGIPVTVVRNYDSRHKTRKDFGYGWSLDVKQGSVQHNRAPDEDWFVTYPYNPGGFAFPCTVTFETKPHFTEVRLSARERYIFRPTLVPASSAPVQSGRCAMSYVYDLVEGTQSGAKLYVVGSNQVAIQLRAPTTDGVQPDADDGGAVTDPFDPSLPFSVNLVQLELRDGRKFQIDVASGIVYAGDRNGNSISIDGQGVHHSGGQSLWFDRDDQQRITQVMDPAGQTVNYSYDLNGDLLEVENPLGEKTTFRYRKDVPHHLHKIIGPSGREMAAMDYDGSGRLKQVCDAEKACAKSSYDLQARRMVHTDATSRPVQYQYDLRGNVTSQKDALNHTVTFAYDANDNLTRAEGPDGSVATYTYDGNGNMLTRVLPYGAGEDAGDFTYRYTYNAFNERETVTLPSGGVIDYDYDARGNQVAVKDGSGNVIASATYNANGTIATKTDRFGTVTFAEYDVTGQPSRTLDIFGEAIEREYDDAGRLVRQLERGAEMEFAYDLLGRPTFSDYGAGATVRYHYGDAADPRWTRLEGPTFGSVTRKFTASGRLGEWTEPNGDTFTRLYDAGGRVEEEIDALGLSTTYDYDAAGRLQAIHDVTLGATTTFVRDIAGRVTDTTDALNHTTHTAYRLGGRLESTTNARGFTTAFNRTPTSSSITDALTRTTATTLSNYGLPMSTTYPGAGSPSTSSLYDGTTRLDGSQSFPTSFTDEADRERSFVYDAHSGLSSTTDLAGNAWQYGYAASKGGAISYDVFSGEVNLVHAQGGASAYGGSGGGTEYRDVPGVGGGARGMFQHHLDSVTSPMGETTQFVRGANGRIEQVIYPDSGVKAVTYGADGQPDSVSLPQGTTLTYTHDATQREVSRVSSLGEQRSFTYGVGDRVETMTDNTGTTLYEYDAVGRFSGIVHPHGGAVRYVRDKLGRTTDVRVLPTAGGTPLVTTYGYDESGNLETIHDPMGGDTSYVYDQADRLMSRTLPNGVVTTYGYDDRDRVLSIEHKNSVGSVLQSVFYERAASGEPTKITREDGSYVVLTYDAALRLDTETYYDASNAVVDAIDYGYDLDGNRTSKNSLSGGFESYAYSDGFKLDTVTRGSTVESFGYDGGGRVTSVDRGGVLRTLEYNSDDKVTRVVDGGVEKVAYQFDGVGRRVGAVEGGATRRYLSAPNVGDGYETPQVVTDGNGAVLEGYVFAGEHPIMRFDGNGNVEYLLQDAMGTVLGVADTSEVVTESARWDAFGELVSGSVSSSAVRGGFGLHGMWLDDVSGLYHVRARTYDARTGRFLSRDPVAGVMGRPESMNPYTFVGSNPLIYRDPNGTFFTLIEVTTAAIIVGILAGGAAAAISNWHYVKNGQITEGQYAGSIFVGATVGGVVGFLGAELGLIEGLIIGNGLIGGAGSEFLNSVVTGQMSSASDYAFAVVGGIVGGVAGAAVVRQLKIVGMMDLSEIGGATARGIAGTSLQVTGTRMVTAGGQAMSPWVRADSVLKFGVDSPEVIGAASNTVVEFVAESVDGVLTTTITAVKASNDE